MSKDMHEKIVAVILACVVILCCTGAAIAIVVFGVVMQWVFFS